MTQRRYILPLVPLLLLGCALTEAIGNAWGTGGGPPLCGGKPAPICSPGCEPGCYYPPMFAGPAGSSHWDCDPVGGLCDGGDPTCGCQPNHGTGGGTTTSTCASADAPCSVDADCCSLNCGVEVCNQ